MRQDKASSWGWILVAAGSVLAASASAGQDPGGEACQKGDGASCLRLGSEQLRLLKDEAASGWYEKACDAREAEGCYAMATYWRAPRGGTREEQNRRAETGIAYADRALALNPKFHWALFVKYTLCERRAITGKGYEVNEEWFARAQALKKEWEQLFQRLRASGDPALHLGEGHDFTHRPIQSKGLVAISEGQRTSLDKDVSFECSGAGLEPFAKQKVSGTPAAVVMRWSAPPLETAWLPIDEKPPYSRTHLTIGGESYAAVALFHEPIDAKSPSGSAVPLSALLPHRTGGRSVGVSGIGAAYRLLFDLPASAVGPRTLRAIMEVPATGARYEVDCRLDGPRSR